MECHVHYVEEYKVLLCISCGHRIVPGSGIRRYLIDHHKEIPLAFWKKIIAYGVSLELDKPHTCMVKLSSSITVLNGFTLIHSCKGRGQLVGQISLSARSQAKTRKIREIEGAIRPRRLEMY
jgi:hypothetical protein